MSHDRLENYLYTSLSCAGFVLLDAELACGMRPDLWGANGGMEASYEMHRPHNANKINAIPGQRFLLRLKGHGRDIEVIARSADQLDRRIEWCTGMKVLDLIDQAELEGVSAMPDAEQVRPRATRGSTDLFAGVVTAEGPRTCSVCENFTAGLWRLPSPHRSQRDGWFTTFPDWAEWPCPSRSVGIKPSLLGRCCIRFSGETEWRC